MKTFRENGYLQGYIHAFSLYPTGGKDDPWEDVRIAYKEVGDALWSALLDDIPVLEQKTRGTENEQMAQGLGRETRATYRQLVA